VDESNRKQEVRGNTDNDFGGKKGRKSLSEDLGVLLAFIDYHDKGIIIIDSEP